MDHAIRGMNMDLTSLAKKHEKTLRMNDFYKVALEGATYKDQLRGIPFLQAYTACFFNATLFDKAGVSYPPTDWADKTWTWEKMIETAKKLTRDVNGDGRIDEYGVVETRDIFELAWGWGGDMFPKESYISGPPTKVALDDQKNYKALVTALQNKADLTYKHKVSPTPAQLQVIEQMGPVLKTGKAGMVMSGDWAIWQPLPKNFKWGIAAVPYSHPERKVCLYTDPMEISSKTKHPEEVWEFVQYLVSDEVQKIFGQRTGRIVSRPSLRGMYIDHISPYVVNTKEQLDQVLDGAFTYAQEDAEHTIFGFYKLQSIWNAEIDPLWLGKKSAKEVVDTMIPKLNSAIKENLESLRKK